MQQYNNNYGYTGGLGPVGYAAASPESQAPTYKNALTPEEMNSIRKGAEQFSLAITQDDFYRGICTHRDNNGVEALIDNNDGTSTCTICGRTFKVAAISELEIEARVESIVDALQTVKLLYLDLPVEATREYFQIIPLLEKLPQLHKLAVNNFTKHESWNSQRFMGSPNTVGLYNMLAGGGINNMYQNPMQGYVPQAPQGYAPQGYPQGYAPQGYPQAPQGYAPQGGSPFFHNPQAPQGYVPQNQQYQYNPQAVQQCAQPAGTIAPTSTTAATDGSTVDVNATFKS